MFRYTLLILLAFCNLVEANLTIPISNIKEGQYSFYEWRTGGILIYKRSHNEVFDGQTVKEQDFDDLVQLSAKKYGNEVATIFSKSKDINFKEFRSIENSLFIAYAVSITSGCKITVVNGLLRDPCTGEKYSDIGISLTNQNNFLLIPFYQIIDENIIVLDSLPANDVIDFSPDTMSKNISLFEKAKELIVWRKYEDVKNLLHRKPKILLEQDSSGVSLLHLLSGKGRLDIVDEKLFETLNLNLTTKTGHTPLSIAKYMKQADSIKLLKKHGAKE